MSIPDNAWELIPLHCRAGLRDYIDHGHRVGGFLCAVLSNDLMEAAGRADGTNRMALHHYAAFLYSYAPRDCYGSSKKIEAWMERGGLHGRHDVAAGAP